MTMEKQTKLFLLYFCVIDKRVQSTLNLVLEKNLYTSMQQFATYESPKP
jgi:hypothetical protein